jgi:hypothetical protein
VASLPPAGAKFIEVIGNLEVPVERMQSALDLAGCIAPMQAQDLEPMFDIWPTNPLIFRERAWRFVTT